jgi:hypothetical protein
VEVEIWSVVVLVLVGSNSIVDVELVVEALSWVEVEDVCGDGVIDEGALIWFLY